MHELTITGPCPARRMILDEGVHLIGRLPESDISLGGDGISREHARIEVHGGEAIVVDQGSMNGTQVEGKNVERHRLEDGDVIGIGRYRLLYRRSEDPADLTEIADPVEEDKLVPLRPEPGAGRKGRTAPRSSDRLEAAGAATLRESRSGGEPSRPRDPEEAPAAEPELRRASGRSRPQPRLGLGLALAQQHESEPQPEPAPASEPAVRRLRVNFKARLALVLLGLVFLSVILIGFGVLTTAEEMMAGEAQSRARTLTYLMAEMNAEKLHSGETRLVTEPFLGEVGVSRALILDEAGHVLAPEALRGQSDPAFEVAARSDDYLRQITPGGALLSVPIRAAGRRYGTAVLDFSIAYLKAKSGHMGTLTLLLGLFVAAVALLCTGILERVAHRPFATLASEVDLVVKGDLRSEVPLTTDSKANQLCEALNRLIQRAGERLQGRVEASSPAPPRGTGAMAVLTELGELLPLGLLGVAEDGRIALCNEAAADLLGCDVPSGRAPHLLDAFSMSPQLGGLAALLKESRQAPDKPLDQRLGGARGLQAHARTLSVDAEPLTLIALEPLT